MKQLVMKMLLRNSRAIRKDRQQVNWHLRTSRYSRSDRFLYFDNDNNSSSSGKETNNNIKALTK